MTPELLDLLERHRPVLRWDRQYDYRAASVLGVVENPGNLLRRPDGEVVARAGTGNPVLSLELLADYPTGLVPSGDDCLAEAPDYLGDARRMEGEARYAGRLYGRVVEEDGMTWLQYWFWLYYNPKNLFGFGKHEGDWEMIQVGLSPAGEPQVATYAQHDSGEARSWREVELSEDGDHPVVYVAPHSHASYFDHGTHPYLLGVDHPYGRGPGDLLPVEPFGPWVEWPGRWGNTERTIAGRVGNGPPGPAHQNPKWGNPARWHRSMRRRRLRGLAGQLMHRLGRVSYPLLPAVSVRLEGRTAIVNYRLANAPLRRSRHLYLTVHAGDRVVASRTVRDAAAIGREAIALPAPMERCSVWASAFNRLRQRSDLAHAESGA